jgi:uncharacterized protein (TIGR03067 family)
MHAAAFLALTLPLAAPQLKDKPAKDPGVVGQWEVHSVALPGRAPSPHSGLTYTFTSDGRWLIEREGKAPMGRGRTYAADLKASPPTIDLVASSAPGPSGPRAGIFEVKGDRLTIAAAASGEARPTRVEPAASVTVYYLRRVANGK